MQRPHSRQTDTSHRGREAKFARWCRGGSWYFFFLSGFCNRDQQTATVSPSKMLRPHPRQRPGPLPSPPRRSPRLVWRNISAVKHGYAPPFSSHRTAAPSALCSSLAMTRQGDGRAFTQTCGVTAAAVSPDDTGTEAVFQNKTDRRDVWFCWKNYNVSDLNSPKCVFSSEHWLCNQISIRLIDQLARLLTDQRLLFVLWCVFWRVCICFIW